VIVDGKVLVISKTAWKEAPRLRHQLTRMFRDIGFSMFYIQTLGFGKEYDNKGEKNITCSNIFEPVHHQLRVFRWIAWVNRFFVKRQITKMTKGIRVKLILNFNYDYDFLSTIFPGVLVLTVINDDFEAMAKPWMKKNIQQVMQSTCAVSSKVITVSYPLMRLLTQYTSDVQLLLPWSDKPYKRPSVGLDRNVVLYYGYISRLDEAVIDELASSGIRLRFIGPMEGNGSYLKDKFGGLPNVEFQQAQHIDSVYFDDVYCSIAPYDMRLGAIKSTTASNRLFRLLAAGIPMVFPDMPDLIKAPDTVIRKCKDPKEFIEALSFFRHNFDKVQTDIENFMVEHTVEKRKDQVLHLLTELGVILK
jgi:hypothetical protein